MRPGGAQNARSIAEFCARQCKTHSCTFMRGIDLYGFANNPRLFR